MKIKLLNTVVGRTYYILLFILLFLFSYMYGEGRDDYYTVHAYLLLVIISTYYLINDIINKNSMHISKTPFLLFILFNILIIITSLIYQDLEHAIIFPISQILLFYLFYSVQIRLKISRKELFEKYFPKLFVIFGSVSFVFAIIAYINYGILDLGLLSIDNSHQIRLTGWFGSPNYTSTVFSLTLISIIFLFQSNLYNKWNKLYLIVLFGIIMFGLILTGSRGAWISFIFAIIIYFIAQIYLKNIKLNLIIYIIFIIISIIPLLFYSLEYIGIDKDLLIEDFVRLDNIERQLDPDNPGRGGRARYWVTSFNSLSNEPIEKVIFGHGRKGTTKIVGRSAHSGYLTTLLNRGIFSLFIILLMLFVFYYKTISILHNRKLQEYIYPLTIMSFLILKNTTNNDFPSNGFSGLVFILIYFSIFIKKK